MRQKTWKTLLFTLVLSLGLSEGHWNPAFAQSSEVGGRTAKEDYLAECMKGVVPQGRSLRDLSEGELTAAQRFCTCTLKGFMTLYPDPNDFVTTVNDIQNGGQEPAEFLNVLNNCLPE